MKNQVVRDIQPKAGMKCNDLIKDMYNAGGFTAKNVAVGADILEQMVRDKTCTRFLSFPACLIATGTRGVIKELVKRKLFDVIITTSGTLDHDLARVWKEYYHGSFLVNDRELHKQGINRLGNVFIPTESYGVILEQKMQPIIDKIYQKNKTWSTKHLIWEFGKSLAHETKGKESILYWAWKNKIPIIVPGITDGAFGSQLWLYYQQHRDLTIDVFKDEQDLSNIIFDAKKTGALIIGGGISKHHVIWWAQFRDGLDYAVYLTTAVEHDGSLSGARPREAISWGKVKEHADNITINGDASVILPLLINSLLDRL